jgi:hypothetical protein
MQNSPTSSTTSSLAFLSTVQKNYQQLPVEKCTWIVVSVLLGLHGIQFWYFYSLFDTFIKKKGDRSQKCILKNLLLNSELLFRVFLIFNFLYFVFYGWVIYHLVKYNRYKKSIELQLFSTQLQQQNLHASNLCAKTPVTFDPKIENEISFILYILSGLIVYSLFRFLWLLSNYNNVQSVEINSPCNKDISTITGPRSWYIVQAILDLMLNGTLMACLYVERQHMHDIFAEQQTEKAIACLP